MAVDQNLARNPWGRAVVVFLQADGEITYQVAGTAKWDAEPGLIVFGVDTVEQAQELQARFCSLDRDGSGRYHFPGIDSSEATRSFEQYFEKHFVAPVPVLRQALELALFGLTRDVDNNGGKIDRIGIVDTIRAALDEGKKTVNK